MNAAEAIDGLYARQHSADRTCFEWQAFASGLKKKRGGRCEICRSPHGLQVHHNYYVRGRRLWEYEGEAVRVLCDACHLGLEDGLRNFRKFIFARLTPGSMQVLNGALLVGLGRHEPLVLAHAVAGLVGDGRMVGKYAEGFQGGMSREGAKGEKEEEHRTSNAERSTLKEEKEPTHP